jgi:hypothetical protein
VPHLVSTAIAKAEYDTLTRVLSIWSRPAMQRYDYYNVPEYIYFGLISAASPGNYYNAFIKDVYG